MQFFDSFSSLGYSAINITLVFAFAIAVIFRSCSLHTQNVKKQIAALFVLLLIFSVPFIVTVNFLASHNKVINEEIRQQGGLKVNPPKLEPTE